MRHLLREHWTIYVCPFGCDLRFTARNECSEHLWNRHSYLMVPTEVEDLVQLSTFNDIEIPRHTYCPFCKMRLKDVEDFQSHVGGHQRRLALFAIPLSTVGGGTKRGIYEEGLPFTQDRVPETVGSVIQDEVETEGPPGLDGHSDTSEDPFDNRSLGVGSYAGGGSRAGMAWRCCYCNQGWMSVATDTMCRDCGSHRCSNCTYAF